MIIYIKKLNYVSKYKQTFKQIYIKQHMLKINLYVKVKKFSSNSFSSQS